MPRKHGPHELTPRETDVYTEILKGKTSIEIGKTLFVEPKTVRFHVTNILRKLKAKSRYELIARARSV